jgi:hypothetical protein
MYSNVSVSFSLFTYGPSWADPYPLYLTLDAALTPLATLATLTALASHASLATLAALAALCQRVVGAGLVGAGLAAATLFHLG